MGLVDGCAPLKTEAVEVRTGVSSPTMTVC